MDAASAPDLWIDRSIGEGRYRLQERLGGGSMGDVFLALDTRIGQIVAIKILKSHWAETEELRRRFEHEVALCAALKSEHIVQIRDYGVTPDGYPYYVMDYLVGQTLGDLLRHQGQLPPGQAVNFIIQACSGLERAHAGILLPNRGETVKIVHRDLKPDNIFIAETSIGALVKILDFGIAKIQNMQRDSTSATNMFIGTFHYASPEQVEVSKQLDSRSDIYSLGIILYEMLSGANPFGLDPAIGEISQMSWAVAHASMPVIPLRSQPGGDRLPTQLEAVVMRCLEKKPKDRFATVQELRQTLQDNLPGLVQERRSPSPWRRSLLLPLSLGFLVAIGISGLILRQLLSNASPQVSQSAQMPLPAMVCHEPPSPPLSEKPDRQESEYKYYGKLEKDLFVGRGTVIYDKGFRYDGDFQNGKKQGCGRFTYPQNAPPYRAYVGQFQNDFPNGLGTIEFVNGAKYMGQVKTTEANLYCQGEGVLVLSNGERIGGTWDQGKHQESQGKYSCLLPP